MIDETQDLDCMMIDMVLNDTTVPKIFVGDPKQSIYKWRGCINGFEYLPPTSLILEFYSTFRIGDPACERIREKFNDCWMISKSSRTTEFISDMSLLKDEKYTYLFRTWRCLLQTARHMKNIWIHDYEDQVEKIRKLHTLLTKSNGKIDNNEFPDDLPLFLKSLSKEALDKLISDIEITSKQEAMIHLYTVHSYKGLEDDNIRLANDINPNDENVYYVALTRGMKYIIEDSVL
jgi:superfamily I DNA/RNA helicase